MSLLLTLTPDPALDVWTRTARVEPTHKLRCAPAHVHPGGNVARVFARGVYLFKRADRTRGRD